MTSANSRLTVARPSAFGPSGRSMKALGASVDHRRLRELEEVAREAGYIPAVTKVEDVLTTLLAVEATGLVLLDMRQLCPQ